MRHFTGFILALAMSAALFFGAGWGISRFVALRAGNGLWTAHALSTANGELAIAAVLGAGLLLGILLASKPVSPLATGLPGLALIGWSLLVVMHSRTALSLVPLAGRSYTDGFTFMLFSGVLALIGIAMVVPLLMPARWRGRTARTDEYATDRLSMPASYDLAP